MNDKKDQPIGIIGIGGKKGSGKDTVASMLNYILYTGVTKANFGEWNNNFKVTTPLNILHFADKLKQCLSILYGISINHFNDHKYKDLYYYCPSECRFIKETDVNENSLEYKIVTIENLKNKNLSYYISIYNDTEFIGNKQNRKAIFKLRTLLQYFGTNICRNSLSENIWVDAISYDINDMVLNTGHVIIADVRFENEINFIKHKPFKNIILYIDNPKCLQDSHFSEEITIDQYDYIIKNDSVLLTLFYKVLEFVNKEL